MVLHENRLPADDSHEILCLICFLFFLRKQNLGSALWVKIDRLLMTLCDTYIDLMIARVLNLQPNGHS